MLKNMRASEASQIFDELQRKESIVSDNSFVKDLMQRNGMSMTFDVSINSSL